MSIGKYAIAEGAISQGDAPAIKTRTPPKRQYVALPDVIAAPEPR